MPTAISIEQIAKHYQPGTPPAVDGITLAIEPGELFFLLGPSGCGKTTLLRMIAGFIEPTAGRIIFGTSDGAKRDVTHMPPNARNTGMVFQSYALWPHMTVAQNVSFGLEIRKIAKAESARRVAEALELVQMGQYAQRKPNALSGGQQQRVALARALVVRPDVLLLDEPLSNLDARLRVELRSEIRRICKSSGITTVYVTHDQKEALSMADRVAIMSVGRVVQLGGPAELYRQPKNKFVAEFLGETNFIPGQSLFIDGEAAEVDTAFGPLRTASRGAMTSPGAALCSLRPEAIRILRPGEATGSLANVLSGRVVDTTYLGEIAQHTIELMPAEYLGAAEKAGSFAASKGGKPMRVKVAQLNPGPVSEVKANQAVSLTVDPTDVVLVPAE